MTVPPEFEHRTLAFLDIPTGMAFTPDERLLITTKNGPLRVYEDGALRSTPAIDLSPQLCTNGERGLEGVAVGPDFADSHYIYLYYSYDKGSDSCGTDPADPAATAVNRISRFVLGDDDVVDPLSETVLIDNIPSPSGIHNAGDLHFGKDGYLYATTGDGGCDYTLASACGPWNNAARYPYALVGKVLRITSDGEVPPDNPYTGPGTARCNLTGRTTPGLWCQEVFATGLRNPFRFAFDEDASSTQFLVNDVGQAHWEEIDEGQAGADYGWNVREGPCVVRSYTDCGSPPAGMTNPLFSYSHVTGCTSITGGAFVPDGTWPDTYDGSYVYGDFICMKLFRLIPNGSGGFSSVDFATDAGRPTAITFGPHGAGQALYYLTTEAPNGLHRIAYTGGANRRPRAVAEASPTNGPVPLDVEFDGTESSDPDGDSLTYEWDFGDSSPVDTGSTATHRYETAGTHTARLEVSDPSGARDAEEIRIDAGNFAPNPGIDTPAPDEQFSVAETFTLSGSAIDPEDGTLANSALTWEVLKHHATHTHPYLPPTTGNDISITAPFPEDFSATTNSYLEIRLTAADSRGQSATVSQDLRPSLVELSFATDPAGLRLEVNGDPAPSSVTSWEGWRVHLSAPDPQWDSSGVGHTFRSWSDGGAQSHEITTPESDTTFTARFTSRYVRPKSASSMRVSLVPAYRACSDPNATHGPPLEHPACIPSIQASDYTTVGTPDANGFEAESVGSVRLKALLGDLGTPGNEADVRLEVSLTDVLDQGADYYVGDVEARIPVRLTDRHSGAAGADSATTAEFPISVVARCVPDVAVGGSTCSAVSTLNALVPGAAVERGRAIWELGAVQVFDGGEDGDVTTPGNGLLATQGVFIP